MPSEFKVNEYLSLRLEDDKTNIYVNGKLHSQCKYLLINLTKNTAQDFENIESIDEAAAKLSDKMEKNHRLISPEEEFWGHCSNLQAWYEHKYDTRLLRGNLAFPLLESLMNNGDPLAKIVFKEEIIKRIKNGYHPVIKFLIEKGFLSYFSNEESYKLDWDIISNTITTWIRSMNRWNSDLKYKQLSRLHSLLKDTPILEKFPEITECAPSNINDLMEMREKYTKIIYMNSREDFATPPSSEELEAFRKGYFVIRAHEKERNES